MYKAYFVAESSLMIFNTHQKQWETTYGVPFCGQIEMITEFPDRYVVYCNFDEFYYLYKTGLYEKITTVSLKLLTHSLK